MSEQFLRKYKAQFGQPISFYEGVVIPQRPQSPTVDNVSAYLTNPKEGVELTQHNMSFNITKTKEGASESSITFYNLSDNTRMFLEQYQKKNPLILLEAGYETDNTLPLLFQGEVIDVKDSFSGHTRVTALTLKSGASNIKEAYSVRSYRAGTSIQTIVRDVIKDMKLPEGTVFFNKDGSDILIDKPVVVNASSMDWVRKFAKQYDLNVWVEDGVANVLPKNFVQKAGEFVHQISTVTGMIGSPTLANGETGLQERQPANKQTLNVNTILNGTYKIGDKVALTSKYYSGVYEIETITHIGTYEGGEWKSSLQIKPVDGWEIAT